ncbi:MAG TPA: matrixin family metalloprotease, partial [Thermoanaerobaculia bacterium]
MRNAVSTLLLTLFVAFATNAATFDRVTDRDLLDRAELVVVATVVDSTTRQVPNGNIYTDSRLRIEDVVKGSAGTTVTVSQLGGFYGDRGIVMPGSASYEVGSRVLAFLISRGNGTYYTAYMGLGKYRFVQDILVRDGDGIDMLDGEAADARYAIEFIDALRTGQPELAGRAPQPAAQATRDWKPASNAVASAYASTATSGGITHPYRWNCPNSCTKSFRVDDTPQPGVDFITGLFNATELWTNEQYSFISLTLSGSHSENTNNSDTNNDIILAGSSTNSECASGIACGIATLTSTTHSWAGDTWYTIIGADVVIEPSVNTQALFEVVAAHEFGHAIGIRHSNQGTPSTTQALMNSTVPSGLNLRTWDREAVSLLYGSGLPCSSVSINSTSGGGTVNAGSTKNLSVSASGSTPFTYQWYEGTSGNTANPVGSNSSSYTTPPINTVRNFWVRVSNGCPSSADSATITVTPQACDQPNITTQPQNTQIVSGGTATLTVAATGDAPLTYKWYRGAVGDTSTQVGTGQSFTTPALTQTTTYWAQVSNTCGTKNSNLATVTVAPCTAASIATQPSNASVELGQNAQLSVIAGGTSPFTYQWYQGDSGNLSQPVAGANSASFSPGPFNTAGTFKYWVRVSNTCGATTNSVNSNTVIVTAGSCVPVSINGQPTSVNLPLGQGATLNVNLQGTAPFTYQWYQGDSGNESQPVGGANGPSLPIGPYNVAGIYKFWVKVSNTCGATTTTLNSVTVVVTVACAEATAPKIAAPAATFYSLAYDVEWTGELDVTPTFEVQEATNADFTQNLKTFTVTGAKKKTILAHLEIENDTRFYYRVRALNACTSQPTAYSSTTSTIINRPQPATSTSFSVSIPDGTSQAIVQDMLVPGFGETATNGDTFSITSDVPWMTIFPPTGALSAGGTTVQITIN